MATKISELPVATSLGENDDLIVNIFDDGESTYTTKRMPASSACVQALGTAAKNMTIIDYEVSGEFSSGQQFIPVFEYDGSRFQVKMATPSYGASL